MGLQTIKSDSTWGKASADINNNFDTLGSEITKVKNATTNNKGYFDTSEELIAMFPSGTSNQIAYVGKSYPYFIWKWDGTKWYDTKQTGGEESLELNSYYPKKEVDEKFTETDAKLSELGSKMITNLHPAQLHDVDILNGDILVGLYTFKNENDANLVNVPNNFPLNKYGFLFVFDSILRVVIEQNSNNVWIKTNNIGWYLITNDVIDELGESKENPISQKAATDNMMIYRGNFQSTDLTSDYKYGFYTFNASDVNGLPSEFGSGYGYIFNYIYVKFLIKNGTDNMWVYNGSTWEAIITHAELTNVITSEIYRDDLGEPLDFNFSDGEILLSDGTSTQNTDTNFKCSYYIEVESRERYVITASTKYKNAIYALYDESFNLISRVLGTSSSVTELNHQNIQIPSTAKYIRLSCYSPINNFSIYKIVKTNSANKLYINKKWAVIGDSLTERNLRTTMSYHDYISYVTGLEVINLGVSGTGYVSKNPFYNRVAQIPTDSSIITVFGSGNDANSGLELGKVTDIELNTICGYINKLITDIQEQFPTTPFGIITPTPWINGEPNESTSRANWFKNYSSALVEICKLRGVPCLDLYHQSNLHPSSESFRNLVYSKDEGNGVHPNELGHKIIAPRIKTFVNSLLV